MSVVQVLIAGALISGMVLFIIAGVGGAVIRAWDDDLDE